MSPWFRWIPLAALALSAPAFAAPELPEGFVDEPVVGPLTFPPTIAFFPDGRVIVTEQWRHWVRVVANDAWAPVDPAGVIDSVTNTSEQGLFGIAVDPRWPAKPYVYLQYCHGWTKSIRIARYAMTGDLGFTGDGHLVLDAASRRLVLHQLPDSVWNHNGGILRFGTDGMLYSSLGDDNSPCGAQSKPLLRGKILRLRVQDLPDGPGPPPALAEITPADNPFADHPDPRARLVWAHGLRNPYSFHLDGPTGAMVIADVGAAGVEEINLAAGAGLNFGWPMYEGFTPRTPCMNADTGSTRPTFPIHFYPWNPEIGSAVISGGMYRAVPGGASSFPAAYDRSIFFSDVYAGFLRRLVPDGSGWRLADSVPGQPSASNWGDGYAGVTDYLIGPDGALWYCKYGEPNPLGYGPGEIRRIRWAGPASAVPWNPGRSFRLDRPAPSPARGPVRLSWTLDAAAECTLDLYDVSGALVRRLSGPGRLGAGRHERIWDRNDVHGRRCSPGLYWARLRAGPEAPAVRSIVLLD